jgi:hypothetical protein
MILLETKRQGAVMEISKARKLYVAPQLIKRNLLVRITAFDTFISIAPPADSDVRLKEDVHQIGFTAYGLPYYSFRYLGRPGVYEGVMAQDVLGVMPEAVMLGSDGYMGVNYEKLGVPFRRIH